MSNSALIAQLLASREQWVDVEPGKAVKLRRPLEDEFRDMLSFEGKLPVLRITLDDLKRLAIDWRGFTEADMLGAGVGNSDPLPFDAEVFALAVGDNMDWLKALRSGLESKVFERLQARLESKGNSSATSTPGPATTVATATD